MNCTGKNCIMQYDKVDPETCPCVPYCPNATPPKSNADKIRAMTDEELALYFADFETKCYLRLEPTEDCDTVNFAKQHLEWLKEEAKENAN